MPSFPVGTCRVSVRLIRAKVCVTNPGFKAGPFSQAAGSLGREDSPARGHKGGLGLPHLTTPQLWQGGDPLPPTSSREALPCWVNAHRPSEPAQGAC